MRPADRHRSPAASLLPDKFTAETQRTPRETEPQWFHSDSASSSPGDASSSSNGSNGSGSADKPAKKAETASTPSKSSSSEKVA